MIKPTIGRVVLYHHPHFVSPVPALICRVWSDSEINVGGFDADGKAFGATDVPLLQEGEAPLEGTRYCEWMPYQKQVASGAIQPTLHAS